ncbi:protein arv1 isoform X1 [Tripterygium wilfordii]|uniref:Protein ARV n=1 Tax=Tripterygium wilfordii TaxID=458696 RepID=A0A7J7CD52_TRIWF|nr:protein ARV 1-like isoform X2 [Tripterygium wilfordii]KAF5732020.1 protein arv1 isoform X1 [Tripterygium wilfordii]
MEYRCVQCGFGIRTLYVQYSPGNIRLMRCENCKAVADEYIECEIMIIAIDLILQKPKAYRNLLCNVLRPEIVNFEGSLWKLCVGFLLLDAYRSLLLRKSNEEWGSSFSLSSLVLVDVVVGNLMFLLAFFVATRTLCNTSLTVSRCKDLLLAMLVSSYFKIFLFAMMVWEFPPSVVYIIDLYVLSSNSIALRVRTGSALNHCIAACFTAHAVKFLAPELLTFRS